MTIDDVQSILNHRFSMSLAGDEMPTTDQVSLGPSVQIWRRYRNDRPDSLETLPEYLAELTVANIVHNEPGVARAKIIRHSPDLDRFLLSDIYARMQLTPCMEDIS